jgi:hypothetical protein
MTDGPLIKRREGDGLLRAEHADELVRAGGDALERMRAAEIQQELTGHGQHDDGPLRIGDMDRIRAQVHASEPAVGSMIDYVRDHPESLGVFYGAIRSYVPGGNASVWDLMSGGPISPPDEDQARWIRAVVEWTPSKDGLCGYAYEAPDVSRGQQAPADLAGNSFGIGVYRDQTVELRALTDYAAPAAASWRGYKMQIPLPDAAGGLLGQKDIHLVGVWADPATITRSDWVEPGWSAKWVAYGQPTKSPTN